MFTALMTAAKPGQAYFAGMGYAPTRLLPTGEWAGVTDMMFTSALCVGLNMDGHRTRFCYPTRLDAEAALRAWDGEGVPPGFWIKQKPEDRPGPGAGR